MKEFYKTYDESRKKIQNTVKIEERECCILIETTKSVNLDFHIY